MSLDVGQHRRLQLLDLTRLESPALSAYRIADWLITADAAKRLARPLKTLRLLTAPSAGERTAVRQAIHDALWAWRGDAAAKPDETTLFYFAGHGIRRSLEDSILLAADFCEPGQAKLARAFHFANVREGMAPSLVSFPEIARTQFYFVDACRNKPELIDKLSNQNATPVFDPDLNSFDDRQAPTIFATVPGGRATGRAGRESAFCEALRHGLENGAEDYERLFGVGPRVWQVKAQSLTHAIGRDAVAYYEDRRDPDLPSAEQELEGLYHTLCLDQDGDVAAELQPELAGRLLDHLGSDVADLPMPTRAAARHLAGRGPLSIAELASLPEPLRAGAQARRRRGRLSHGDSAAVLAEADLVPQEASSATLPSDELVEAMYAEARFAPAIMGEFVRELGTKRELPARRDLLALPIWRAALALLATPGGRPTRTRLAGEFRREVDRMAASWEEGWLGLERDLRRYANALVSLLGVGPTRPPKRTDAGDPVQNWGGFTLRSTADLRILVLAGSEMLAGPREEYAHWDYALSLLPLSVLARESPTAASAAVVSSPLLVSLRQRIAAARQTDLGMAEINRWLRELGLEKAGLHELRLILGDAGCRAALRGTTPEFHPPTRTGLAQALKDPRQWRKLAAVLQDEAPAWPIELSPEWFAGVVERDPARWFATLIEVADQMGLLGRLLSTGCALAPRDKRLADVARLFGRYHALLGRRLAVWPPPALTNQDTIA